MNLEKSQWGYSIVLSTNGTIESIGILDGEKIPLKSLSFGQRTFATMCTGFMDNQVFETVEEVLQTTQGEILSSQKQLGQKGLENLVEVIEKLGYELKEK